MIQKNENKKHRFCAIIAARNEELVIGRIVDSLVSQEYPKELLDVWVAPNNCTDNTETVAKQHGAKIFNCKGYVHCKGDVLSQFFYHMLLENDIYDGYCIFDADNIVDKHFISAMNDAYCSGVRLAQGYKGSVNPSDSCWTNWQAILFGGANLLSERSKPKGEPILLIGAGNLISAEVLKKVKFDTVSITEDTEYFCKCSLNNVRVEYVEDAVFYEEHPADFRTAWVQGRRWLSGCYICNKIYGKKILEAVKKRDNKLVSLALFTVRGIYLELVSFIAIMIMALLAIFCTSPIRTVCNVILVIIGIMFVAVNIVSAFLVIIKGKRKDISILAALTYWVYMLFEFACGVLTCIKPSFKWEPIKRNITNKAYKG